MSPAGDSGQASSRLIPLERHPRAILSHQAAVSAQLLGVAGGSERLRSGVGLCRLYEVDGHEPELGRLTTTTMSDFVADIVWIGAFLRKVKDVVHGIEPIRQDVAPAPSGER